MLPKRNILVMLKLVQRENAVRFILISLLSFIATVTIVRTFLVITGYPQLGSGTLHIAHVLWGGLILYIAAILPLLYLNPRVNMLVAILSGVGVGLFIDEVGKFITRQYDYFYPAAAPIMYVFFLLVVILVVMVNRPDRMDGRSELLQALDTVQEQLYRPLDAGEKQRFEKEISLVMQSDPNPLYVGLARHLLEFVRADERTLPDITPAWWLRMIERFESWMDELRIRRLLEFGFLISGVLSLKNPIQLWLERNVPNSKLVLYLHTHFGRQLQAVDAPVLYNVRLSMEVIMGILLVASAILLVLRRRRWAINLGFFALLVSLAVLDMLLFYFEQFSSVLIVLLQFIVLFGVLYYRRKYLNSTVEKLDIKT